MTELRINGFDQIVSVLKKLIPFIKFKRKQAEILYRAIRLLISSKKKRSRKQMLQLIDYMIAIQNENYVTKKKKSRNEFLKMLEMTP
jgi:hypothetical protein